MAHFKLQLITPNNDKSFHLSDFNQEETFLATLITDFKSQREAYNQNKNIQLEDKVDENETSHILSGDFSAHTVSHTYNEKLTLQTNSQKKLQFNLDERIFTNNEWVENPFAHILKIGTQIELTDKYNNCMLFTINKIDHEFHNLNLVYKIECIDSFTYQLTHQNEGYKIDNDENSIEYIGALDIDQWAQRITKDCYVTYEYVSLEQEIYQDVMGELHYSNIPGTKTNTAIESTKTNVQKIIKPIYNRNDYKEFFETFPFSLSSSNAAAALIAAAQVLGLQLNVVESRVNNTNPIKYIRWFYFGPTKNPETSGLEYSPLRDIQNFSLSLAGNSLTTVLNVKSTTWQDQEIGLFPVIPAFLTSIILSDTNWTQSTYYTGYFTDLIKGRIYTDPAILDVENYNIIDNALLIPFNKAILSNWPLQYNKIACVSSENQETRIVYGPNTFTNHSHAMGIACFSNEFTSSLRDILESSTSSSETIFGSTVYLPDQLTLINFKQQDWNIIDTNTNEKYVVTLLNTGTTNNPIYKLYAFKDCGNGDYQSADIYDLIDLLDHLYIDSSYYADSGLLYYSEYEDIPLELLERYNNNNINLYFYIRDAGTLITTAVPGFIENHCFIFLTRTYTQDELDFAAIADECPWLENKIIDFSYFYQLGVISKKEYENLLDVIQNDLRIINGQLMCYATSYFEAVKNRVDVLSKIQEKVDKLGAQFYADIVEPYSRQGSINANISNFTAEYQQVFNSNNQDISNNGLLKRNATIEDYFNKYFLAEQRFLKNMYNFRQYFEAPNIYCGNGENLLQEVKYTIKVNEHTNKDQKLIVGFNKTINWTLLNSDTIKQIAYAETQGGNTTYTYNIAPLYKWKGKNYVQQAIPNEKNYKDFYIAEVQANSLVSVRGNHIYNPHNTYLWKYTTDSSFISIFGESPQDQNKVTIENTTYIRLSYLQILKLFLSQPGNLNNYYIRDTKKRVPWDWIRCNKNVINDAMSILIWTGLEQYQKFLDSLWFNFDHSDDEAQFLDMVWPFYKSLMPLDSVYLYDYNYNYKTLDNNETLEWYLIDENGQPYKHEKQDSINYYYQYDFKTKDYSTTPINIDNLYKTYFSVDILNYKGNLSSLFNQSSNDTTMTVWNLNNVSSFLSSWAKESNYYTKKVCFNWGTFWGKMALHLFVPGPWSAFVPSPWYTAWTPAGATDYRLDPTSRWSVLNLNNGTIGNLGDTSQVRGDSYWINYLKSADAEDTICDLHNSITSSGLVDTASKYHYNDYYKYVVLTYSTASMQHSDALDLKENYNTSDSSSWSYSSYNNARFFAKNKYARFCVANDTLSSKDDYYWIKAQTVVDDKTINLIKVDSNNCPILLDGDWSHRFGAIKFYPIIEGKEFIDLSLYFTKEELDLQPKILDIIQMCGGTVDANQPGLFIISGQKYYILHIENYEKATISTQTVYTNGNNYIISYKDLQLTDNIYRKYNKDNTQPELGFSDLPLKTQDIVLSSYDQQLYYISQEDAELTLVNDIANPAEIWNTRDIQHWYSSKDIKDKTYTLQQILDDNTLNYYFIDNSLLTTTEICKKEFSFNKIFSIYVYKYILNEDKSLLIDQSTEYHDISISLDTTHQNFTYELKNPFDEAGDPFIISISRIVTKTLDIGHMSNGEFWFNLRNYLSQQDLLEKVAVIETQLTEYWTQAYTASQYCQWFIPPSWTMEIENKTNFFSKWLYSSSTANHRLKLLNKFIPNVEVYTYEHETVLPAYRFIYGSREDIKTYFIDEIPDLQNNPSVHHAISHIFKDQLNIEDNLNIFTVQEQGLTTYYYWTGGGIQWKDVIHFLDANEAVYSHFDGLYCMQLMLLLSKYSEATNYLYERTLDKKINFWRRLYARFPGIFLEKTYENKDIRSSEQLLKMAKLAFRDYTSPEKQYNLTFIDAQALDGYQGQELHIGDGILLKTSDYYKSIDETYRALNQYLFITDINYELRSDTGISLTVNAIKYQDKLLQSIVKLIR